jgi:hypothetical protein
MKKFVLAALLASFAAFAAVPALAETFKIPEDGAIVTVDVPDKGWTATPIARGIELSDDDDEVYLSIEGIEMKKTEEIATEAVAYLNRAGVTIDRSTEKKVEGKLGNFPMYDIGWEGKDKDKDGDIVVHLTILGITSTKGVLFTYWASPTGDKENEEAIVKMVRSIKQVGR